MRCEEFRANLDAQVDGETTARQGMFAAAHVVRCEACRAERRALLRLIRLSRRLPCAPLPADSEARLLAALPVSSAPSGTPVSMRRGRMALFGIAVTAVFAVGLFLLPAGSHRDASAVAQVRRALARVNTWHLKGWRTVDGQQVPWEVWAQRSPFFYREQLGDDLTLDDGTTRTVLVGPYDYRDRQPKGGMAFRLPSLPDDENMRWSSRRLLDTLTRETAPPSRTREGLFFHHLTVQGRVSPDAPWAFHQLYFVDRQTWLPSLFETREGPGTGDMAVENTTTTARLFVEYGEAIPAAALARPNIPPGYAAYDAFEGSPVKELPASAASTGGLTLALSPLASGADGTIIARLDAWLGSHRLTARESARLHLNFTPWEYGGDVRRTAGGMTGLYDPDLWEPTGGAIDDRGRLYAPLVWPRMVVANAVADTPLVAYTPVEPLQPNDAPARTLTVKMPIELTLDARTNEALMDGSDPSMRLASVSARLVIPMPHAVPNLDVAAEHAISHVSGGQVNEEDRPLLDTLEASIYAIRAQYYMASATNAVQRGKLIRDQRPDIARWTYWKLLQTRASSSPWIIYDRLNLAQSLTFTNKQLARQVLTEAVGDQRYKQLQPKAQAQAVQARAKARQMLESLAQ